MNNDLISREALKEVIAEKATFIDGDSVYKIIELIDNAQPASDRYDEGYAQGYIDGSTGADWEGGAV